MSRLAAAIREQRVLMILLLCVGAGCGKTSLTLLSPGAPSHIESNSTAKDGTVQATEPRVARVLGRDIVTGELDPPTDSPVPRKREFTESEVREYRLQKLSSLILQPLLDQYADQNQIEPTKEEIDSFIDAFGNRVEQESEPAFLDGLRKKAADPDAEEKDRQQSAELLKFLEQTREGSLNDRLTAFLRKKLASPDLDEADRKSIEEELKINEEYSPKKMAERVVRRWKLDKALHAQYGGVVIFQQANPTEPVGAYRRFLEEREKKGDLEILEAELREQFWHYFLRDHPAAMRDDEAKRAFDKPWWLKVDK